MHTYQNSVILGRKGQPLLAHNWEAVPDQVTGRYPLSPATVRRILHTFLSVLPDYSLEIVNTLSGSTRQVLSLNDLRIRDRLLNSLEDQAAENEPEVVLLEDAHQHQLLKWFETYGVQVFGASSPFIHDAITGGEAQPPRLAVVPKSKGGA